MSTEAKGCHGVSKRIKRDSHPLCPLLFIQNNTTQASNFQYISQTQTTPEHQRFAYFTFPPTPSPQTIKMRFTIATIAALISTGVIAAPAPQASADLTETVVINDFSARHQTSGAVDSVGLHITSVTSDDADNLLCSKTGDVVLGEKYACGDSKYSFALVKGTAETWAVRLFHRWGVA